MPLTAGLHGRDQFGFGGEDRCAGFVNRLMDRPDTQVNPQPIVQKFLKARARRPEAQAERHDQRAQSGADEAPFGQGRVHRSLARCSVTITH